MQKQIISLDNLIIQCDGTKEEYQKGIDWFTRHGKIIPTNYTLLDYHVSHPYLSFHPLSNTYSPNTIVGYGGNLERLNYSKIILCKDLDNYKVMKPKAPKWKNIWKND